MQQRTTWRSIAVGLAIAGSVAAALLVLARLISTPPAIPPGTAAAAVACRQLEHVPPASVAAQIAAAARTAAEASSSWDDLALRTAKYALTGDDRDRREALAACARAGVARSAPGSATPRTGIPSPVP